ncbi:ATP-binding protein [Rheinheimera baltica]|uniref:histidine kinase n=1 Tax=Rheinheimera baltica TaxID=67576 RepID=A0ABT9I483_9GAMM|nr:ATP-binding protein [Rheinheimera baltica]MDP5138203.1 ATP-binding protein [Rheinheimera baltica]MDP5141143.1 ATP-binding protein [Rheinheimera baltica]MDP5148372.1 ATP-binding protein [Rheinheimera baltica]MDP5189138.1 ATP-binding protein [Rheinheimera baltica]
MKITKKLTLTLISITAFILLVNLALARWSFDQGLKDFVAGIEQQRLQRLSIDLIIEYQNSANSWQTFDSTSLHDFITQSQRQSARAPARRPPPHMPPPHRRQPLPENVNNMPPTALYDMQGQLISGDITSAGAEIIRVPVMLNTEQIAELRSELTVKNISPSASQFSRQQLWASLVIGLLCLLAATVVSHLVAIRLLRPVKQVLTGVKQLSNGDYSVKFSHHASDELGELMHNLEGLSLTLDKNRSAKNRWFANISHELRTPLTVLQGEIEVLKAGIRPFNQQQLESFAQEVRLLHRLVDDLYQLSTSDIGALRYHFTAVNLSQCLADTIQSLAPQAQFKQLKLQLKAADNIMIKGDEQRIEQLLLNLLTNSLAYTDAPGSIEVSLCCTRDKSQHRVCLTIEDSAPGVPTTDLEMIFDPLYRLDSSRQKRDSGAGLGLALCKNIADAHQASIRAIPAKLGGLCIEVIFHRLQDNQHAD